jgi:hypothetical protein
MKMLKHSVRKYKYVEWRGRGGARPSMLHFPFLHFTMISVLVIFRAKERW